MPAEITSFVDRRTEVIEVRRLLVDARLVTLTGAAGVGKTRLALRAAAGVGRDLRDGAWLVELAEISDPTLVSLAVVQALGVHDPLGRPPLDLLIEFFRTRQALLVLDNCEHLVDACAELTNVLLREIDTARVLVTSREVLATAGEHVFRVPPLAVPDSRVPRGRTTFSAVALFAERAGAAVPTFALTGENEDAVTAVCRRLDGLPLAIELAAIRLRTLSLEQILRRLDDRFAVLDTSRRHATPHLRTLRAAVEWSFDLCTPPEQMVWARLSVFAGSFALDAAEGICAGGDVDREAMVGILDGLVAKSIVQVREEDGQVRFRLLETLREYGQRRLRESGAETRQRRRHADWYLALAEHGEREWFGPQELSWLGRMHAEHANLRAALDFCFADAGDVRTGVRLATSLWFYWANSGPLTEAAYWLDRALTLDPEPSALRAKALWVDGYVAVRRTDYGRAADILARARAMAAEFDERRLEAWIVGRQQSMAMLVSDHERAVALGDETLRLFEEAGDSGGAGAAIAYCATASAQMFRNDAAAAIAASERAIAICRACGERWVQCHAVNNLARVAWMGGEPDLAVEHARAALRLRRRGPLPLSLLPTLELLAWATEAAGQYGRAATLLGAVREVRRLYEVSVAASAPPELFADPSREAEERTREALGQRAFAHAFQRGVHMPVDEVVAYALGETPKPSRQPSGPRVTPRERQVARLVAEGLSNRQIAARLSISERTAESHIDHLLSKLDFASRSEIAAWAAAQDEDN